MTKPRVLVVDDSFSDRFFITSALHDLDIKDVTHSPSGIDAISKIKSGLLFDLVFLDIHMPRMDGYEVMRTLKELEKTNKSLNFELVVISDHDSLAKSKRFIKKGTHSQLVKSIKSETMKIFNNRSNLCLQ